ncbi:MAG TPA: DUF72 domain-containing protein [Acetobacteraceae bacterium]|nr:DUF72 domain-containing protein [Acetobacteraceae bacterium]
MIIIGTAGWSISRPHAARFPATGSGLERYAAVLGGVEINSSFYRPHKPETYARWADTVPDRFRFAVKCPRSITHERRLTGVEEPLTRFLGEVSALGSKLGPILVQLPPSLRFEQGVATPFFALLRARHNGAIICEPRHPSWFGVEAESCLLDQGIGRVAADPAPVPEAAHPGGFVDLAYFRLHGSPVMYHSEYDAAHIARMATLLAESPAAERWCIFDNTASGAALGNTLALQDMLSSALRSAAPDQG